MPDLGKYAAEVTLAYAGSLTLLVAILAISVWRARHVRNALNEIESQRKHT
jgi:heme exporter protein D